MKLWTTIRDALRRDGRCAMVTVAAVEGSAPREAGARLLVLPGGFHGTIGGGALEWRALAKAQAALDTDEERVIWSNHTLGPELGQCCGGRVRLLTELFGTSALPMVEQFAEREREGPFSTIGTIGDSAITRIVSDKPRVSGQISIVRDTIVERFGADARRLMLFGAGHVGRSLVLALAPLPFEVSWIDGRDNAFPSHIPANATAYRLESHADALATAPSGSFVLVMTHSHALDLEIVLAALAARRFPYVGLIGSATKRARFVRRLSGAGLAPADTASLVCPIGMPGIGSKHPAAIAASTAAQLLQRDEEVRAGTRHEAPHQDLRLASRLRIAEGAS